MTNISGVSPVPMPQLMAHITNPLRLFPLPELRGSLRMSINRQLPIIRDGAEKKTYYPVMMGVWERIEKQ